jgi:hypothetical protein
MPVFVGGTGRSGTSVLGRLLGRHPEILFVGGEIKHHATSPVGMAGLLEGEIALDEFLELLRGRAWSDPHPARGADRGLYQYLSRPAFDRAVAAFAERFPDDPYRAGRELILAIVHDRWSVSGKPRFAEATPDNAFSAHHLVRMFDDLRLIHIVRDGRDTAASVTGVHFGPDDLDAALEWWGKRLRRADASIRQLPAEQVLTVSLEALTTLDRDATRQRIFDFLGVRDAGAARNFHNRKMPQERGHVGRWARGLDADPAAAFDERYRELLARMREDGVQCVDVLPDPAAVAPVGNV